MIGNSNQIALGVNGKTSNGLSDVQYEEFVVAGAPQDTFVLPKPANKVKVEVDAVAQSIINNEFVFDGNKTITLTNPALVDSLVTIWGF